MKFKRNTKTQYHRSFKGLFTGLLLIFATLMVSGQARAYGGSPSPEVACFERKAGLLSNYGSLHSCAFTCTPNSQGTDCTDGPNPALQLLQSLVSDFGSAFDTRHIDVNYPNSIDLFKHLVQGTLDQKEYFCNDKEETLNDLVAKFYECTTPRACQRDCDKESDACLSQHPSVIGIFGCHDAYLSCEEYNNSCDAVATPNDPGKAVHLRQINPATEAVPAVSKQVDAAPSLSGSDFKVKVNAVPSDVVKVDVIPVDNRNPPTGSNPSSAAPISGNDFNVKVNADENPPKVDTKILITYVDPCGDGYCDVDAGECQSCQKDCKPFILCFRP